MHINRGVPPRRGDDRSRAAWRRCWLVVAALVAVALLLTVREQQISTTIVVVFVVAARVGMWSMRRFRGGRGDRQG